ncbi:MAG TPA: FkbM family methyltransferase [Mucilaginibacter sp.]|jgi:FkbM family methyltransferase|nr:FkbM family methyltransferase [Mucilaginibacter sp.]
MNFIKRLIPNNIKQEGKYILYDLLKIPYNRHGLPVVIMEWLSADKPITFIDIGASKGDFATSITKSYTIKKGILIEPLSSRIQGLNERFPNKAIFDILNLAVSDQSGEADFYDATEWNVMSSLLEIKPEFYEAHVLTSPGKKIKVQTETLDNIVGQRKLDLVDLLKIDVQGAEHLVLGSAENMLKKTKLVYSEVSYRPLYEGSSTFFDIYKLLNERNFRFVAISTAGKMNGEIIQGDALFVNNGLCP